jgi:two-component system CheB/CheR fusion protein
MKSMSEEFEATREELQSANEEVLSSNEELQSINEELETSTEELQSTNEELITINDELQRSIGNLKESVEYSDAIVQTIIEPLVVLDAHMRVKSANHAFHATFKTSEEEIQGSNFFTLLNGQWDVMGLRKMLETVVNTNDNFRRFEISHSFPKLGEKILLLSAMVLKRAGRGSNDVMLIIEDITQAKKSELRLKESEERFRLLVQNAFDITTVFAEDGTIVYESDSVERILGYKVGERIGENIFKDPIVHPSDLHLKEKMFTASKANPGKNISAEFRLRHKNGDYKFIEAVCVNLLDQPAVNGILANYHDITEQRILERQREEFVSIASHELKTPITSLKGYVQIMQDMFSSAQDEMAIEIIKKLDHQLDRLTVLIKELFDVTRIREGQLKFDISNFDIDKLISEVVNEIQLGTKKHVIVSDLNARKKIEADREKVGQVITNLLSNAIKYSPVSDKVIVTSTSTNENVTVCVQDFGIGISPDVQKKIFERFFRLSDDKLSQFPGLGLGLYIASEIVKGHGGTIVVKSNKGDGSIFCFTIPMKYSPS